jgi:hypothetical protein
LKKTNSEIILGFFSELSCNVSGGGGVWCVVVLQHLKHNCTGKVFKMKKKMERQNFLSKINILLKKISIAVAF